MQYHCIDSKTKKLCLHQERACDVVHPFGRCDAPLIGAPVGGDVGEQGHDGLVYVGEGEQEAGAVQDVDVHKPLVLIRALGGWR